MHYRRTKIIATFGPALRDKVKLAKVIDLGVDVIRFNFSHHTPKTAENDYNFIESIAKKRKKMITYLADLKGPEIRIDDRVYTLQANETIAFVPEHLKLTNNLAKNITTIKIDHKNLYQIIKKKLIITADDGLFKFKVLKIESKTKAIYCKVLVGGVLTSKKSLNISRLDLKLPILSESDRQNLGFIVKKKFSWIAASFVSSPEQVHSIKNEIQLISGNPKFHIPIISKIENYRGVKNIEKIIDASEGIMVARGDLAQDYSYEDIPSLQDLIIKKTKQQGKVCIIATQLLNGMITSHTPTRSEVSDINHGVRDKVDALMLSGETAAGKYPFRSVEVMDRVIKKTERELSKKGTYLEPIKNSHYLMPICLNALNFTSSLKAKCFVTISEQGRTPIFLSGLRSKELIFATTQNRENYLRNRLYYSIQPILLKKTHNKMHLLEGTIEYLKSKKILKSGNKVVSIYSDRDRNKNRVDHIIQVEVS